ncbi:hypothetical protein BN2537_15911 [Streptomyces venezuelae]|nr:hypothetical protein BN2537_15911 [Streptomyces venezuelae]
MSPPPHEPHHRHGQFDNIVQGRERFFVHTRVGPVRQAGIGM